MRSEFFDGAAEGIDAIAIIKIGFFRFDRGISGTFVQLTFRFKHCSFASFTINSSSFMHLS